MSKVIKLKQEEIEKIVETLLEDISQDGDTIVNPSAEDTPSETDLYDTLNPKTQNLLQKFDFEIRPGTDEISPSGGKIGLGRDSDENVYIIDYETDKLLAIIKP
jgi:DNA-binding beta-propeller fold protein YncE